MESEANLFRNSTYEELLARNSSQPAVIERIKNNIIETVSILINGLSYQSVSSFCRDTQRKIISKSCYYDYLHIVGPVIQKLAIKTCQDNLANTLKGEFIKVGFDGCWAHRRRAHQCMGVLIDLISEKIICYAIAHHGKENDDITIISTDKNSKCLESVNLQAIIENTEI